ncbi:hypothetical protein ANTRET_LOCUS3193 [Anthophora retusa]
MPSYGTAKEMILLRMKIVLFEVVTSALTWVRCLKKCSTYRVCQRPAGWKTPCENSSVDPGQTRSRRSRRRPEFVAFSAAVSSKKRSSCSVKKQS